MRILLVEDDQLLAQGLVTALERLHYRVEHCISGNQALQAAQNSLFDVMILDLGLPDGLALPVIKTLRASNQALPILVLTAWDHLETKIDVLDAAAHGVLDCALLGNAEVEMVEYLTRKLG